MVTKEKIIFKVSNLKRQSTLQVLVPPSAKMKASRKEAREMLVLPLFQSHSCSHL